MCLFLELLKKRKNYSEQTDSRAERILHVCRTMALDARFESVLRIDFNQAGHFNSPVPVAQHDNFDKSAVQVPPQPPPMDQPPIIGNTYLLFDASSLGSG